MQPASAAEQHAACTLVAACVNTCALLELCFAAVGMRELNPLNTCDALAGNKTTHFKRIHKASGIAYKDMLVRGGLN